MNIGQSRTARLAAAVVARHELAAAVRVLNRAGVLPMPLRGVLLQHIVYQDPADRAPSPATLLVPPGRFEDARDVLRAAGYTMIAWIEAGIRVESPDALRVDLHARPFAPGLYGLQGSGMFARGRIEEGLLDGVVVLPDPRDLYAYLIGRFAIGRHGRRAREMLRDFSAVASRFGLAEQPLARHLERHGLARATRYSLAYADDGFSRKLLRALRPDLVGDASASVARLLTTRYGKRARITRLAPHLVNRTLPRGLLSVGADVAFGMRKRLFEPSD